MSEVARLQAIVHGRVQGVNFRYYTRQQARGLGITGYVRNMWDGTVEVVAEGVRSRLEELLTWLRRGPSMAFVEKVEVQWLDHTGEFRNFEVRY